MKAITPSNIAEFAPRYPEFKARNPAGEDGTISFESLCQSVTEWNQESAIGFEKPELEILGLILLADSSNTRFNNNKFIHPTMGGSSAEHPLFIGHRVDSVRDKAGYGPATFAKQDADHRLVAARLSQKLHALAALHDIGELVDVSRTEEEMLGVKHKEPLTERAMARLKLKLAAHALSSGDPAAYWNIIDNARTKLQQKKDELLERVRTQKIEGNQFILQFGLESQWAINAAEKQSLMQKPLDKQYEKALHSLSHLYEQTHNDKGFATTLFQLLNALEGDAGFRHYAGRKPEIPPAGQPMLQRLFGDGKTLSLEMASSSRILKTVRHSQEKIMPVLQALETMHPGPERDVAEQFARTAISELLRNHIRLLQKSPPLLDLTGADRRSAISSNKPSIQNVEFKKRLSVQQNLAAKLQQSRSFAAYPITELDEVVDTKTLIALFDKAATAIENGTYLPTQKFLPISKRGTLPPELQITFEDLKECGKKYPLTTATAYEGTGVTLR